jgi:hypothetical protein
MRNRLWVLCKVFGWQGGTIHQAREEAENCLEEEQKDILSMSDEEFENLVERLDRLYPAYKNWQQELVDDYRREYE